MLYLQSVERQEEAEDKLQLPKTPIGGATFTKRRIGIRTLSFGANWNRTFYVLTAEIKISSMDGALRFTLCIYVFNLFFSFKPQISYDQDQLWYRIKFQYSGWDDSYFVTTQTWHLQILSNLRINVATKSVFKHLIIYKYPLHIKCFINLPHLTCSHKLLPSKNS